MNAVRALRKLLFGETWLLPLGLSIAVALAVAMRHVLGARWHEVGGFVLLASVVVVVVASVGRSAASR